MSISRRNVMRLAAGAAALPTFATSALASTNRITVGALRFTSEGPTFLALERGYFKDEGLDAKIEFFQAAQPMAVAVASGDVDFGVTAVTAGLISLAEKGALKVIGGALQEEPGIDGQIILASRQAWEAGLKSPRDLRNRSFGITTHGSSFHYMIHKVADKVGIRLSEIQLKPLQQIGVLVGSLSTGQIDAWSIVPDIGKTLIAKPEVKKIGEIAEYIPDYQVTTVFTATKLILERKDVVQRFMKARARAVADFNGALVGPNAGQKAAEDVLRVLHKYVMSDRPFEVAAPLIRNGAMRIAERSQLHAGSIRDQLDWFKSEKLVPPAVTFDMLVDSGFAPMKA